MRHCLESSGWRVPSSWGHHVAAEKRVADVPKETTTLVDEKTGEEKSEEAVRVSEQAKSDYEAEVANNTE